MANPEVTLAREEKESAVDFVLRNVKEWFITRKIRSGDRLPSEGELCQLFGVSRGTIREAMKILAATGVVEVKRGDGTYVADVFAQTLFDPLMFKMFCSSHTVRDIVQLREMLEIAVVELIIRNADTESIDKLEGINNRLRQELASSVDVQKAYEYDIAYHRCMGECTKNPLLRILYEFAIDFLESSISDMYKDLRGDPQAVIIMSPVHHDRMITAMRTRNVELARDAIRAAMKSFVTGLSDREESGGR